MEAGWKSNKGKGIRIVLIDSGVQKDHPQLAQYSFEGVSIKSDEENGAIITDNINDTIGHGSAVAYIIKNTVPQADVFIIKLFDENFRTTTCDLIAALQYVEANIQADIVHLSNGVTACDQLQELKDICGRITSRGTVMVAAFDNGGAISYPSAFENVIGVDFSIYCKKITHYEFIEGDTVNIRGVGIEQRLPWVPSTYKLVSGSSFSAPYVTSYIAKMMESGIREQGAILEELRRTATGIRQFKEFKPVEEAFPIKKAVVFPFNKEVHSIVRFSDLLQFELAGVYDSKLLCNVGKPVSDLVKTDSDIDLTIKNIDKLDWNEDFDTLILSHTKELSSISSREFTPELLEKCCEHGKNVYAFDDLSEYEPLVKKMTEKGLKVFYPKFVPDYINKNCFGKLRKVAQPVLGVFGTSPKQGKHTLQLTLRRILMGMGYKVGQLGTEPSALLFGMNEVYPMGYGSTVSVAGFEAVAAVNSLLGRIEDTNPDIILVGSQSQTIPLSTGNIGLYPVAQHELILGCEPDAYILCVNVYDELDYIRRTILYLESIIPSKVISLVLFPINRNLHWSVLGSSFDMVSEEELEAKRKELSGVSNRKVFILGRANEMEQLAEACIDFFTQ